MAEDNKKSDEAKPAYIQPHKEMAAACIRVVALLIQASGRGNNANDIET